MVKEVKVEFIDNQRMLKNASYLKRMADILISNNNDFVPSLFERIEHGETIEEKVRFRVNEKLRHGYHYIVATDELDEIVGFTEINICETEIFNKVEYSITVGTSAIHKEFHGKGVGKKLYRFLDDLAVKLGVDVIIRRTWSTNARQLKLYGEFGYKEFERYPNLRGEGLDSIAFCKWFKEDKSFEHQIIQFEQHKSFEEQVG